MTWGAGSRAWIALGIALSAAFAVLAHTALVEGASPALGAFVVMMWLSEPGETTPSVSIPGMLTSTALMIGVLVTLVLGVWPSPLLDLTTDVSNFIR